MTVSGKTACEISAAGLGMMFGAVSSGMSGGTATAPLMLLGGAGGYLIGKAVCRISALQKAFDRAFGSGDWSTLDVVLADPVTRAQAVALIEGEVGVSAARATQIWDTLVTAVRANPRAIMQSASFKTANYHPATGSAKHGIAVLNLTSPSGA